MKLKLSLLLPVATVLLFTTQAHAGKAEPRPALAKPGKQIVDEGFAGAALDKSSWSAAKGSWNPVGGVLVGKENASDNHAAVLMLQKPARDSIIQFAFKLDGAKGFNLSYNSAKGHLFRVVINEDGLVISKDKDKKNPKSRAEVLGKASGKFSQGEWHTLLVEIKGEKVLVQADNGARAEGSHQELNTDKTGFRFVTRGESLLLDNVKVWEVQ